MGIYTHWGGAGNGAAGVNWGVYCPPTNKVAQYIATHTIMEFCLAVELKPGLRLSRRWWEDPALDILGIRVGHAGT